MTHLAPIAVALGLASQVLLAQDPDPLRSMSEGRQMSSEQASAAEAQVAANPDSVQDRVRLLGYYAAQSRNPAVPDTMQGKRIGQILWLVEHHPELRILTTPDAAVTAGQSMLDQLKQSWHQALATHSDDARVLANAAWFFRLSDKEQALDLLRRASAAHPEDRALADRLGTEYALVLLGVTETDPTERALRSDPVQANSSLAQTARAELEQSPHAAVLFAAGNALNSYHADLLRAGAASWDMLPFAASLIERAKALDPNLAPTRIRVSGNVMAANLVAKVDPVYPPLALQARIQGVVRFTATIGKDGTVGNLQLISGHPLLIAAATEAVKQWIYKPTLLNGAPVEVITQIDVNFTLNTLPPPSNQI